MVIRLEHVGIAVPQEKYDETVQFYQRAFGWHHIKDVPGLGCFIGDGQGGRLEVMYKPATPLHDPHHLAFAVTQAEFEGVMAALRDAGAALDAPETNPLGEPMVYFSDPAGNRAQVVGRKEPLAP